jgi:CHAD domain-containing protein
VSAATSAKIDVPLAFEQRADAAAAMVLRALLEVILANRDGAFAGEDTEYLHRLRISVRRSRTVQRQLAGVFPALELDGFRSEFRWLQRATGEARDLDVYLSDFESVCELVPEPIRADLDPLRQVLGHWRLAANGEMARALRSRRAQELLSDWDALLESLVEYELEDRPAATEPIGRLAGKRIRAVYKRVVRLGRRIDESSPAVDYHELRKKGKELRYLLELFGGKLFPEEVVAPLVKSLKALQDVLGRHQDREVQIALLRSLADEVATLSGGPAALMAMGVLVDRLQVDEVAARAEFAERFDALAAGEQHRLVKETFGPNSLRS